MDKSSLKPSWDKEGEPRDGVGGNFKSREWLWLHIQGPQCLRWLACWAHLQWGSRRGGGREIEETEQTQQTLQGVGGPGTALGGAGC